MSLSRISRRGFIVALSSAPSWPNVARAQQPLRAKRVAILDLAPASAWADEVEAFRAGLRELGYVEGKNVVLEFRWADGVEQLPECAAELVRMKVDIIIAPASTEVEPVRQATKTIPIVFAQHADPVGLGHVASLAHPGGNITGVSMVLTELAAKGLEILKDVLPSAKKIGVLWNPTTPSHKLVVKEVGIAAQRLGVQLLMLPIETVADFDGVFETMAQEHADGFTVAGSPLTNMQRTLLAELELKHRLPGIFGHRAHVEAGCLMSYGANFKYMYRRTAFYVDKILKGEKPADLPVEQVSKYELVINLKTASALGLTIPPSVLARADEVIE
jgi:putative tryptophan/tyrosine transport system substrate-binding protein